MAFVEKTNKPLKKSSGKGASAPIIDDDDVFATKENVSEGAVPKKKTPKKKTVEETYQKLTQLEHVLLRPDTYIGSVEMNRTKLWVYDTDVGLNQRDVTYVPGQQLACPNPRPCPADNLLSASTMAEQTPRRSLQNFRRDSGECCRQQAARQGWHVAFSRHPHATRCGLAAAFAGAHIHRCVLLCYLNSLVMFSVF